MQYEHVDSGNIATVQTRMVAERLLAALKDRFNHDQCATLRERDHDFVIERIDFDDDYEGLDRAREFALGFLAAIK